MNAPDSGPAITAAASAAGRVRPYVPRTVQQHLVDDPKGRWWTAEGTAVLVDISGFTQLSEQLAAKGREGAEQITDVVGESFESILSVAYQNHGGLLKFGGDALLIWFHDEGHAERACRAAVLMREKLDEVGRVELRDARVALQMSQGVHSGEFHFFLAGSSHLEFLPAGPAWSRLVAMEKAAAGGEIVLSLESAQLLPAACTGEPRADGVLLAQSPPGESGKLEVTEAPPVPADTLVRCLSKSIRAHVQAGGGTSEHRPVTIAFIRFEGTDALIERHGAPAAADALQQVVTAVEAATEEHDVALLGSDVDADGGKLILTAGAPKVTGSDEERMLLALRRIVSSELPVPLRIGVNRGAVFAGDIGPAYRRTYTVMGDAVNLAARLMAHAERGHVYATRDVLDRSDTLFETAELAPFAVKGKAEPIVAWSVGKAKGSRTRQVTLQKLPITGRNNELGVLRKALGAARSGKGCLLDVSGAAGIGKTRLLEALRDAATTAGFRKLHAICETYTSTIPYVVWRELLREMLGFGRDDADEAVEARVREEIAARDPELAQWMPLLGAVFGLETASTAEVDMLAESNRRAKLHETVAGFLVAMAPDRLLIEIENVHQMDEASAELLSYLVGQVESKPWLFAVARRPADTGFDPADSPALVRVELKPLALQDAVRMAQLTVPQASLPAHVLDVVAKRSGGNPQFLRDLLRSAVESGVVADLPDSAEAAAMKQIDLLDAEDRALVRRASVFGLTFHPRMLAWLYDDEEGPPPGTDALLGLRDIFEEEPDGYLHFRHSLLRDSAYAGLPFKLRRKLHGAVAENLERESDAPEDVGNILSLHYLEAGDYRKCWVYAIAAAKQASAVYAHVEASNLYVRALDASRRLPDLSRPDVAATQTALGDSWYAAGEFGKASEAYAAARALVADPLQSASLLLKLSRTEVKLGQCETALRLAQEARGAVSGIAGPDAARQAARSTSYCAAILQIEGRTTEALEWAERATTEAEAADEAEALADAYMVMGWAHGELGKEGGVEFMERSLAAYRRTRNFEMQASVLVNLGVVCQWEGRWDEALEYYERGRAEAVKVGSTVASAIARMNIAEILADRGEWAEAESLLRETLRSLKASHYNNALGACLLYLGRVSLGLRRFDEALSELEDAKSNFHHVGAEQHVPAVDARIAECYVGMGKLDAALELVDGLLERASESPGIARVLPLLQRVKAHALLQQGDLWGARDALDASLAAAKERHEDFEATLTQLSLIELDRLEGVEPDLEIVTQSRSVLADLKVRAVPPIPSPAQ